MQLITRILEFFPYLASQAELLHQIVNTEEPVLLTGPTGAGKSRLARLIHENGLRFEQKCASVNLAELSHNLFESELFGHKKGSFTNALNDHVGLIEETSGGDLIIEDISEMPLELQAKFLRFQDEQTIRRIGSTQLRPVNVRLIMTTNRDLRQEVAAKRFRSDLYHRLVNGWHLALPPLSQVPAASLQKILDNLIREMRQKYQTVVTGKERGSAVKNAIWIRTARASAPFKAYISNVCGVIKISIAYSLNWRYISSRVGFN